MKKPLKIVLIVLAVLVLLVGGLLLSAYYAFLRTEPLTTTEIESLEVDWTPVTNGNWSPWVTADDGTQEWNPAKSFNNWLATVPEEDKVWEGLVEARIGHREFFRNRYLGHLPQEKAQWERLIPALDSQEAKEVYQKLIESMDRPVMGCELFNQSNPIEVAIAKKYGEEWAADAIPVKVDEEVEMLHALLPALGKQKAVSNFIVSYGARSIELGDADEFVRACRVVWQSAKLAEEIPSLIGQLVKFAIGTEVVEAIDWAMDQHADEFTDQQLAELGSLLAEPDFYKLHWQSECLMFQDTIRRLANEKGALKPWVLQAKMKEIGSAPLGDATNRSVAQMHASAQRLIYIHQEYLKREFADQSDPDFKTGNIFYRQERGKLGHFERNILDMLVPSVSRSMHVSTESRRSANAVALAIAIRRHQLRYGVLPDGIDELDEDIIVGLDISDPFTQLPLVYERTENGIFVLSGHAENETGEIIWPKEYEQIADPETLDEPRYFDWELEGLTPEEIEAMQDGP